MIWTTRCCRTWRKENKILVSLKITHMIWHIRCFGKWKKGLVDSSKNNMKHLHFSTFRLFEIENETLPLFNFSTFRLLEILFTLTYFPTKPCSVFFQPRRISYIGGKPWTNRWIPVDFSHLPMGWVRLNSGSFSRVNLVRERLSGSLRVCKASASHWGLMIWCLLH